MSSIRKTFIVALAAVLVSFLFFMTLGFILKPPVIQQEYKRPFELRKKAQNYNDLTPEIFEAILALEDSNFQVNRRPIEYSTRFYKVSARSPRVLEGHYYPPDAAKNFLLNNHIASNYAMFNNIADFIYKNPRQDILIPLSDLGLKLFLENAYYYRLDGYVEDLEHACHGGSKCVPVSAYYNLDEKKIIGYHGLEIMRRTRIDKPQSVETPPYPKTKP